MNNRLVEVAYKLLEEKNTPLAFKTLWDNVIQQLNLDPERVIDKISDFYSDLVLDGRFIVLENNVWDLRKNHHVDKTLIDPTLLIEEDEDESFDSTL